jgi:nuclear transport factor 2 (NTF2) superfamily protein
MKNLVPPFTMETAKLKVQAAEDAWNSKNPEKVSMAYTVDSQWRNRDQFFTGRASIVAFLTDKWKDETCYKLKKYLWSFTDNRISVRFEYEWRDFKTGQWKRTHGNEHWEFDEEGLMQIRDMSANDIDIEEHDKKFI